MSAGEPLNPEVIETWKEATGLHIREGYGQTETVMIVGMFPSLPPRTGSMGKPSPGYAREIEFVAELPKTVSGKIRRAELRGR